MAEARCRADWARTSALMALAVNLVRDPRRTPAAKPNDFNPYAPRSKKPILRGKQLEILRDVFVKKNSMEEAQPEPFFDISNVNVKKPPND